MPNLVAVDGSKEAAEALGFAPEGVVRRAELPVTVVR